MTRIKDLYGYWDDRGNWHHTPFIGLSPARQYLRNQEIINNNSKIVQNNQNRLKYHHVNTK